MTANALAPIKARSTPNAAVYQVINAFALISVPNLRMPTYVRMPSSACVTMKTINAISPKRQRRHARIRTLGDAQVECHAAYTIGPEVRQTISRGQYLRQIEVCLT